MTGGTGRDPGSHRKPRRLAPVLLATLLACGGASAPLRASPAPSLQASADEAAGWVGAALKRELADRAPADLKPFYAARGWRPLWISSAGRPADAAHILAEQVRGARIDDVKPSRVKPAPLLKALDRLADGNPDSEVEDLARVELAASRLLVAWVQSMRGAPGDKMIYESEALAPVVPTAAAALASAARAPSLDDYVADMGWMHPFYAPLREALLDPSRPDDERRILALNLSRVRAIPGYPADRYVLVDAAGARLWMMENGKPIGTMKVVVGKADNQTPIMAGFIRYATLNPYWNVPDDLVSQRVARNVLDRGTGYLKASGYQVLSGWEDDARPLDPSSVDWAAVASGIQQVRVRQLPGGDNFMGAVKFEFPNPLGIYLHDTPSKDLMLKDERQFSSGCVRLEDAPRLGRWLMGKPLPRKVKGAEQRMDLPQPVPVYITYLTALPVPATRGRPATIAFQPDPYGRDGGLGQPRLATLSR